ncbi:MAG: PhoH family protein [Verrucomicrobia bacterium]|nr:PhoH family protein [Verrucomicrobiota bacterium]MDA1005051.1 PhoH family protein [Verrucomicrobiota bacterium]
MSESGSSEDQLKLEFETPQFLQSLFANDFKELRYLEEALRLRVVSREGWILLSGAPDQVEKGRKLFGDLEEARRGGAEFTGQSFRLAVDLAAGGSEVGVADLAQLRLLGTRSRRSITPRTARQFEYLKAMRGHPVVFGLGPAGTGKTYLAMAMGIALLKEGEVNRIVLTRPAVEAGEALGFLPGDIQEKVAPYLRPLYDALHDMLDPVEGQRYLEDGTIEIAPLAYMRGRTLARSFVILDEAQNTTREQMFMLLTRLGEGSRCVVTGDGSQVDLKAGVRSGLEEAERALAGVEGIGIVRFSGSDVVRHPIVGRIVEAYGVHRAADEGSGGA